MIPQNPRKPKSSWVRKKDGKEGRKREEGRKEGTKKGKTKYAILSNLMWHKRFINVIIYSTVDKT